MRYVLGIDTSGSDTLAGVVIDGKTVAADVNTSRLKNSGRNKAAQFQEFNHDHLAFISAVVEQAVLDAGITYDQLEAIAVTRGPGLVSALEVGLNFAKGLALSLGKPLIAVHHNEGHLYSLRLAQPFREIEFPALALIVSGSTTELLLVRAYGHYESIGGTTDDTVGETIEKIGKVLGFAYPAGSLIEQSANLGNPAAYQFTRVVRADDSNLSLNAIKLAVLNEITVGTAGASKPAPGAKRQLRADISINDVCASLQNAIFETVAKKTARAAQKHGTREILVVGGVAANHQLRQTMSKNTNLPVRFPPLHLCANTGLMIAAAGFAALDAGLEDSLDIEPVPLWPLGSAAGS